MAAIVVKAWVEDPLMFCTDRDCVTGEITLEPPEVLMVMTTLVAYRKALSELVLWLVFKNGSSQGAKALKVKFKLPDSTTGTGSLIDGWSNVIVGITHETKEKSKMKAM